MINLIACVDTNGGLGKDGKILYHIPEDNAIFKAMTFGKVVAVGRKTWEGLPAAYKRSVFAHILTQNANYDGGGQYLHSVHTNAKAMVDNATEMFANAESDLWVIGGSQLYKLFLPVANNIFLGTWKGEPKEADAFFPEFTSHNRTTVYSTKNYDFACYKLGI